ncbi:glycosyl hydrolase family 17 protein [Aliiglaciecola litoralis]|uniref:Endo-1,3-beta-glucanase btgC n=1 Tax=Aliiglaciecola litoralis TaxID=582857 RepID=A0ABN1LPA8_9ALTE
MSKNHYRSRSFALAGIDFSTYSDEQLKVLVTERLQQKIHGISFSPYTVGQGPGSPISEQDIADRLSVISPYVNWIRTFSCSQGNEFIPSVAKQRGLNTMVGVWLDGDLDKNQQEIDKAIEIANQGHADMLGVGNEVLLRGELTPEQLVGYLEQVKSAVTDVPVGYVDAYFEFEDYPQVTDACDIIFANCYPYWEGYPSEHALIYMKDMYRRAQKVAKGKPVIISETGWPNVGTAERAARPSFRNAISYFLNAYQWADEENIDMFYFSSFDEAWKIADEGDVGAYWGLWDEDGKAKYGNYSG